MRWDLLWYVPLAAFSLSIAAFNGVEGYKYGRVIMSHWAWSLLFSPATGCWIGATLTSIHIPLTLLATVATFFDPSGDVYTKRYRAAAGCFGLMLVLVFGTWILAWGSFPLEFASDGLYTRMIPFIPWPTAPF